MKEAIPLGPFRILLVEDNPADAAIVRLALNRCRRLTDSRLHHVPDGEQALRYLRGMEPGAQGPPPDLVLLDINLPGMGGIECLSQIRKAPALTHLPVMILSSSDAHGDILRSYQLHANAYVHKPVGIEELLKVFEAIADFWFIVAKLPAASEGRRPSLD